MRPKASIISTGLDSGWNDRYNKIIVLTIKRGSDLIRVGDQSTYDRYTEGSEFIPHLLTSGINPDLLLHGYDFSYYIRSFRHWNANR
jgi:hypothetical protein